MSGAVACVDSGFEFAAHLCRGDDGFAVQMPTALGKALVFQLDHGRARALKAAHGALHIQRVAKAGVGIDDDGRGHPLSDARQRVLHLGKGGQANVGAGQARVGDGRAREVQRLKARLLGHQRGERVVHAGSQHCAGLGESVF